MVMFSLLHSPVPYAYLGLMCCVFVLHIFGVLSPCFQATGIYRYMDMYFSLNVCQELFCSDYYLLVTCELLWR